MSYLWSPQEQGPASPETFSYSMSDASPSPPLRFLLPRPNTYGGCFPPRGASSSCAPIGPRRACAAVTSGPAAPAALNGPSSLSDPLQNSSARHGTDNPPSTPGIESYSRGLTGHRGADTEASAPGGWLHYFFFLIYFSRRRDGVVRPPCCGCMCVRLSPGLDHDDAKCGGPTDRESCKEFTGDSRSATAT